MFLTLRDLERKMYNNNIAYLAEKGKWQIFNSPMLRELNKTNCNYVFYYKSYKNMALDLIYKIYNAKGPVRMYIEI